MQKVLETISETKESVLVMEVKHYDGKYVLRVTKETHEKKDGYIMTEFMLFANGNISIVLGNGRKSEKKLTTLNNILSDNFETWANKWANDFNNLKFDVWNATDKVFNK